MARFCGECGKALAQGARFCTGCGRAVAGASSATPEPVAQPPPPPQSLAPPPEQPAAPAPSVSAAAREPQPSVEEWADIVPYAESYDDPDHETRPIWRNPAAIAAACFAGVVVIFLVVVFWIGGTRDREDGDNATFAGVSNEVAIESDETPYADVFLSDNDETLRVQSTANVRDRPTAEGTTVLRELHPGEEVTGRWVRGLDLTTRWLRVDGQTVQYVWAENLGPRLILDDILTGEYGRAHGDADELFDDFVYSIYQGRVSGVQGQPFRVQGIPHELRPLLIRDSSDNLLAELPLEGSFFGLSFRGFRIEGNLPQGVYSMIFEEKVDDVVDVLHTLGFTLGEDMENYLSVRVIQEDVITVIEVRGMQFRYNPQYDFS